MKRTLKIIGITIGSLIGVLLLLVTTALWVVFTPERLTPIVRSIASDYVLCDHKIEKVELTFFSTFPKPVFCFFLYCRGVSPFSLLNIRQKY